MGKKEKTPRLLAFLYGEAAEATRPKIQRYAGANLLNREEVEALLGILRRDQTALGKRIYAFTLARLYLGSR